MNSLREAYLSWQPASGASILEAGRINLRYGPGYGYYPTDFFRDGSLRTSTTADPLALLAAHRLARLVDPREGAGAGRGSVGPVTRQR